MEHGAAAVGESCFFVERNRPQISLPHPKPEMCAIEGSGGIVNCAHELLSDALALRRAINIEAVQLDRPRGGDTGWGILALNLREGHQHFAVVREQRDHICISSGRLSAPKVSAKVRAAKAANAAASLSRPARIRMAFGQALLALSATGATVLVLQFAMLA